MSPELETLDQLLGGELSLAIIRQVYPSAEAFMQGILGLLTCGDVRLLTLDQNEVPRWRWRELFINGTVMEALDSMKLEITDQGTRKIT